jgi:hypothetical protein
MIFLGKFLKSFLEPCCLETFFYNKMAIFCHKKLIDWVMFSNWYVLLLNGYDETKDFD